MSYKTYRSALKKVLADSANDPDPDMNKVARRAIELLDEELVVQAAVTHIRQMARKEWNQLQESNTQGLSREVVFIDGEDLWLGNATPEQREALAASREWLGDGLKNRAEYLRNFEDIGDTAVALTVKEVLRAERRADALVSIVDSLRDLVVVENGVSRIESHLMAALESELSELEDLRREVNELEVIATKMIDEVDDYFRLPRTRRAIVRMALSLGIRES